VTLFKVTFFCTAFLVSTIGFAQVEISGSVTDSATGTPLEFVTVNIGDSLGTLTNRDGQFSMSTSSPGLYKIKFSYIGYKSQTLEVHALSSQNNVYQIQLAYRPVRIGEGVVVTAGRYEQPISEVTVSMEVIQKQTIQDINPATTEEVLDQVPGVTVTKSQVSIRGGSSWNFGAGSRVMLLVDGLPMLSGDAKDIKWTALPLEAIQQVEVIKGASSALYGASALDGTINLRTIDPSVKPVTSLSIWGATYGDPPDPQYRYWSEPPRAGRIQAMAGRKFGDFSVLASVDLLQTDGYRLGETRDVKKLFVKLRHQPRAVKGLTYGLNITALTDTGGNFLYWQDLNNPYLPDTGTITRLNNRRYAFDPVVHYVTSKNSRHSLLGRVFITDNETNASRDSKGVSYYGEYQYQKFFDLADDYRITWNHGLVGNLSSTESDSIYGDHEEVNYAIYGQLSQKIGRVNFSFGTRLETFQIDTFKRELHPIFRSGLVVQAAAGTFIRASLGQGIRFPSVAERYTQTTGGGVVIFPNPDLIPEKGWTAEAGIKQLFGGKKAQGFLDLALFWSEYRDMIEFTFGNYAPPFGFGFAALNVTDARIYGLELSTGVQFEGGKVKHRVGGGYTFLTPMDLNHTPSVNDSLGTEQFLKYRYRHFAKLTYTARYKFLSLSLFGRYNSYMLNIDEVLTFVVSDLAEYRKANEHGDLIIDLSLSATFLKYIQLGFHVKNLMNQEFTYFPANMGPPRNYAIRISYRI
jgi:iron complex outermembrane receptor protein